MWIGCDILGYLHVCSSPEGHVKGSQRGRIIHSTVTLVILSNMKYLIIVLFFLPLSATITHPSGSQTIATPSPIDLYSHLAGHCCRIGKEANSCAYTIQAFLNKNWNDWCRVVFEKCCQMAVSTANPCPSGFAMTNGSCQDVDECDIRPRLCGHDEVCLNTNGSFTCTKITCGDGQKGLNGVCVDLEVCDKGYQFNGLACVNIDECREMRKPCSEGYICQDSIGSFDCIKDTCSQGFKLVYRGYGTSAFLCEDINECDSGQHDCRQNQVCLNVPGSYVCREDLFTRRNGIVKPSHATRKISTVLSTSLQGRFDEELEDMIKVIDKE